MRSGHCARECHSHKCARPRFGCSRPPTTRHTPLVAVNTWMAPWGWAGKSWIFGGKFVYFCIFRKNALTFLILNIFPWKFLWNQVSFWNVYFRGLLRYFGSQKGTQNIWEMLVFREKCGILIPYFQEKSTFPKKWSPSENENITKDPGNERFRIRSYHRKVIKHILK